MGSENVLLEAVHSVLLLASGLPGARHTNAQRKATVALKLFLRRELPSPYIKLTQPKHSELGL